MVEKSFRRNIRFHARSVRTVGKAGFRTAFRKSANSLGKTRRGIRCRCERQGQGDVQSPTIRTGLEAQLAAQARRNRTHDRQAQTRSWLRHARAAKKTFTRTAQLVCRHAGAVVAHGHGGEPAIATESNRDLATALGVADGVVQQIGQGFFQQARVGYQQQRLVGGFETQIDALSLSREGFNSCILHNAQMAVSVMRGLVMRLRKANQKIASLALFSVFGRVARYLLDMAEDGEAGQLVVKKKVSHAAIAREVGASREMVSKALKEFETQGFIRKLDDGTLAITERRAKARV